MNISTPKTKTGLRAEKKIKLPMTNFTSKEDAQRELRQLTHNLYLLGLQAMNRRIGWEDYGKISKEMEYEIRRLKNILEL